MKRQSKISTAKTRQALKNHLEKWYFYFTEQRSLSSQQVLYLLDLFFMNCIGKSANVFAPKSIILLSVKFKGRFWALMWTFLNK